jgi:mRNA interferase MazF
LELFFKEREIWWCYLGTNIGSEQNGSGENLERPILIIKKIHQKLFIGLPITSKIKVIPYYFQISPINGKQNSVLIHQIRVLSSERLRRRISNLNKEYFYQIKALLKDFI